MFLLTHNYYWMDVTLGVETPWRICVYSANEQLKKNRKKILAKSSSIDNNRSLEDALASFFFVVVEL